MKKINFEQLYKEISYEEMYDKFNLSRLVGEEFYAITSGKENYYNAMIGSGGGFGFHLKKPTSWCNIRADRHTLELIKKELTYTISYFPTDYKKELFFLASKTGRNTEKMKEVKLVSIQTPSGNISFKEAKLIIECKLIQLTKAPLEDFYSEEAKKFVTDAYKEENHFREIAFGEITNIWVKK